ncbi:cytochrome P450 [Pilobolus umbonatus]|nr:cytochrome P450 [Pilobolus umbonatus]
MSSFIPDSHFGRALGLSLSVLTALAIKYPDRAIFDEHRENIPTKGGLPLIGGLYHLMINSDKVHEHLSNAFKSNDSLTVTQSILGQPRTMMTIHPDNVEHILKNNFENYVKGPVFNAATEQMFGHGIFNANGEQWKNQRKTASHIFNVKNFRDHFTEVFVANLRIASKVVFDKAIKDHEIIDFHSLMFKFTLDSFTYLGFGVNLDSLLKKENVQFADSFDFCQQGSFNRFVNPFWRITEPILKVCNPFSKTFEQHLAIIDTFAADVIARRRKEIANGETGHKDLLSRFMSATNMNDDPLSDSELRDVVLNFIIAGRDTTAQALSWSFYMLLTHKRIENKLLKEIQETITDDLWEDPPRLYEVVKDMKYAHSVFYEVLRLFPSVPNNQKYALNDDVWPDGTVLKKGDYVMWCPWAQGRSEAVWGPDAKEFKPERWITPTGELRRETQGQWPAFHGGPRVCLGQNLATLQALVVMIFIMKNYKMQLVPDQDITYQVSLTLPMKNGLKVMVERR